MAALQTIGLVDSSLLIKEDPRYTKLPWRQQLLQVSGAAGLPIVAAAHLLCVQKTCGRAMPGTQAMAGGAVLCGSIASAGQALQRLAGFYCLQMVPELSSTANDSLVADASAVSGEAAVSEMPMAFQKWARAHASTMLATAHLFCRLHRWSRLLCLCMPLAPAAPDRPPIVSLPLPAEELNRAYANHEIVGDYLTACLAWFEAGGSLPLAGLVQQVGRRVACTAVGHQLADCADVHGRSLLHCG